MHQQSSAKTPNDSKHLVRCACHCLDACFKPYKLLFNHTINLPRQPTATLTRTHMRVFLKVRLHECLLNIKMAQLKIQFVSHRCQQPNLGNSNNSRPNKYPKSMFALCSFFRATSPPSAFVNQLYSFVFRLKIHIALK